MKYIFRNRLILLGCLISFSFNHITAQNSRSFFYENELDISLPLKSKWSMVMGLGNRGMLQERQGGEEISDYHHEHLELNHFTNYHPRESLVLSLGLRYRFRELFDTAEKDEFRLIEQLEIQPVNSNFGHRFRLEQRFREHLIHRLRYEFGYSGSINEKFSFGVGTEAIYAVSAPLKPEAEQRFSLGIENSSFKNVELGLTFEYRMENYTQELAHEFFIITGVTFSL